MTSEDLEYNMIDSNDEDVLLAIREWVGNRYENLNCEDAYVNRSGSFSDDMEIIVLNKILNC